jgi:hypothetical protein
VRRGKEEMEGGVGPWRSLNIFWIAPTLESEDMARLGLEEVTAAAGAAAAGAAATGEAAEGIDGDR